MTNANAHYKRQSAADKLAKFHADMARAGGKARAANLSPQRRSDIASKAARARWRKP